MTTHHYLEVVTPAVDATCALYEASAGARFGEPVAELGGARTAQLPGGTLLGVRSPLAEHDKPIVRHYVATDDIAQAVRAAEGRGALVAYPPTEQGDYGTFAIVLLDGVQHGLWQRREVASRAETKDDVRTFLAGALAQFGRDLSDVDPNVPMEDLLGDGALDLMLYLEEFYDMDLDYNQSVEEYVSSISAEISRRGYGRIDGS